MIPRFSLGAGLAGAVLLVLAPARMFGQWPLYPTAGVPKTADGKPDLTAPAPRTPEGKPDLKADGVADVSAIDFNDLARQLGA